MSTGIQIDWFKVLKDFKEWWGGDDQYGVREEIKMHAAIVTIVLIFSFLVFLVFFLAP